MKLANKPHAQAAEAEGVSVVAEDVETAADATNFGSFRIKYVKGKARQPRQKT